MKKTTTTTKKSISPWLFDGIEFTSDDIGEYQGFVYIIINTLKKELNQIGELTGDPMKSFKKMSKKVMRKILKDIFYPYIQQEVIAISKKQNNNLSTTYWNPTNTITETLTENGKTDQDILSKKEKLPKKDLPKMYGNYLRHDEYLKLIYRS